MDHTIDKKVERWEMFFSQGEQKSVIFDRLGCWILVLRRYRIFYLLKSLEIKIRLTVQSLVRKRIKTGTTALL